MGIISQLITGGGTTLCDEICICQNRKNIMNLRPAISWRRFIMFNTSATVLLGNPPEQPQIIAIISQAHHGAGRFTYKTGPFLE